MTQVIRRSMSYTQGIGRSTSFKLTLPGIYGSIIPRSITVCESCGQSHEQGKNHLFDYPLEVDDDLMCQVCLQPLVEPVDTACGHTFCYNCITSHLRRNPSCPCDRRPLHERDIKPSSLLVRRILDKLRVVCPNTAYCDATMPRSSLERHLRLSCPGTYVHCPREREGCQHVGPRSQLEEHLWTCMYGEDKDPKTGKMLPIPEGYPCIVELPKGDSDLGLIVSQCERTGALIIEDIFVEGNAERDGRLMPGDQILEIDNHDYSQKSLAEARLALSMNIPLIRLTVLRRHQDYDSSEFEEVELIKDDMRPLGIQIQTYTTQPGIYVHHLVAGSPADECGSINIGDRILEANGYDIRYSSIDEAASLMANASGVIRLLIAHKRRLSSGSDMSCRSHHSVHSNQSDRSYRSPDHSYRSSSGRRMRLYEEIIAPTGFPIGGGKCIIIRKNPGESFGMNVSGGIGSEGGDLPVFISVVRPNSPVDKCRKIQKGDILVSINSIPLTDKTHSEVVQIIKSLTSTSVVRLEMIQGDEVFEEDGGLSPDWKIWIDRYNGIRNSSPLEYTITLAREGNESLGFSIVGGINSPKGDSPIYIKGIASKSIAAIDGRIKCRDQIISINGVSVDGKTQLQVVDMIRSSSGDLTLNIIPHDTYC